MSEVRFRHITIFLLAFTLGTSYACAFASDGRQPNIIYLMLDDAGYGDFGAFGSPYVKTPNFDRLCAEA